MMQEFHLRLSRQDYQALAKLACRDDRPMASMIRKLIRDKALSMGFYGPAEIPDLGRRRDRAGTKSK